MRSFPITEVQPQDELYWLVHGVSATRGVPGAFPAPRVAAIMRSMASKTSRHPLLPNSNRIKLIRHLSRTLASNPNQAHGLPKSNADELDPDGKGLQPWKSEVELDSLPQGWSRFLQAVLKKDYAIGYFLLAILGNSTLALTSLMSALTQRQASSAMNSPRQPPPPRSRSSPGHLAPTPAAGGEAGGSVVSPDLPFGQQGLATIPSGSDPTSTVARLLQSLGMPFEDVQEILASGDVPTDSNFLKLLESAADGQRALTGFGAVAADQGQRAMQWAAGGPSFLAKQLGSMVEGMQSSASTAASGLGSAIEQVVAAAPTSFEVTNLASSLYGSDSDQEDLPAYSRVLDDYIVSGGTSSVVPRSGDIFGGDHGRWSSNNGGGGWGGGGGGGGGAGRGNSDGGQGWNSDDPRLQHMKQWLPVALALSLVLPPAAMQHIISQLVASLKALLNRAWTPRGLPTELVVRFSSGHRSLRNSSSQLPLSQRLDAEAPRAAALAAAVSGLGVSAGAAHGSEFARRLQQRWAEALQYDFAAEPGTVLASEWPAPAGREPLPGTALHALNFLGQVGSTPQELVAHIQSLEAQLQDASNAAAAMAAKAVTNAAFANVMAAHHAEAARSSRNITGIPSPAQSMEETSVASSVASDILDLIDDSPLSVSLQLQQLLATSEDASVVRLGARVGSVTSRGAASDRHSDYGQSSETSMDHEDGRVDVVLGLRVAVEHSKPFDEFHKGLLGLVNNLGSSLEKLQESEAAVAASLMAELAVTKAVLHGKVADVQSQNDHLIDQTKALLCHVQQAAANTTPLPVKSTLDQDMVQLDVHPLGAQHDDILDTFSALQRHVDVLVQGATSSKSMRDEHQRHAESADVLVQQLQQLHDVAAAAEAQAMAKAAEAEAFQQELQTHLQQALTHVHSLDADKQELQAKVHELEAQAAAQAHALEAECRELQAKLQAAIADVQSLDVTGRQIAADAQATGDEAVSGILSANQQLQARVLHLEGQLAAKVMEMESQQRGLQLHMDQSAAGIQALSGAKVQLEVQIRELEAHSAVVALDAAAQHQLLESHLERTMNELQSLEAAKQQLQAMVDGLQLQLAAANQENGELQGKVQGLESRLEQTVSNLHSLDAAKQQLQASLDELQPQLAAANQENGELQGKVQGLESRLEQTVGNLHSLDAAKQQLQASLDELQPQLAAANQENGELQGKVQGLESRLEQTVSNLHSLDAAKQQLQASLDELQPQLAAANQENGELQGKVQGLESRLEQTVSNLHCLDAAKQQLQASLDELQPQLAAANQENGELQGKVQGLVSRLEQTVSNLHSLDAAKQQLQASLDELQPQLAAANQENGELQGNVDSLQTEISRLEGAQHQLLTHLQDAQAQAQLGSSANTELQGKLLKLQEQLEQAVRDKLELEAELQSLAACMTSSQAQMQQQLADLQHETASAANAQDLLHAELQALRQGAVEKQQLEVALQDAQQQASQLAVIRQELVDKLRMLEQQVAASAARHVVELAVSKLVLLDKVEGDASTARAQQTMLEQQLLALQQENEAAACERECLQQQGVTMQAMFGEAVAAQQQLQIKVDKLQQELDAVTTGQQQLEVSKREMQRRAEEATRFRRDMEALLGAAQKSADEGVVRGTVQLALARAELVAENERLQHQLESLMAQHQDLLRDFQVSSGALAVKAAALQSAADATESSNDNQMLLLKEELSVMDAMSQLLINNNQVLQTHLSAARQDMEAFNASAAHSQHQLEVKCQELQSQVELLQGEASATCIARDQLQNQVEELQLQAGDAQSARQQLQVQTEEASAAEQRLQLQVQELEAHVISLAAAKEQLQARMMELQNHAASLEAARRELLDQLEDMRVRADLAAAASAQLEERVEELQGQAEEAASIKQQLQGQVQRLQQLAQTSVEAQSFLQEQLGELQEEVALAGAMKEELEETVETLQSRADELADARVVLESRVGELQEEADARTVHHMVELAMARAVLLAEISELQENVTQLTAGYHFIIAGYDQWEQTYGAMGRQENARLFDIQETIPEGEEGVESAPLPSIVLGDDDEPVTPQQKVPDGSSPNKNSLMKRMTQQIMEMQRQIQLLQQDMQAGHASLAVAQSVPTRFDLSDFTDRGRHANGFQTPVPPFSLSPLPTPDTEGKRRESGMRFVPDMNFIFSLAGPLASMGESTASGSAATPARSARFLSPVRLGSLSQGPASSNKGSPFLSPSRPLLQRVEQLQLKLDALNQMVVEADHALDAAEQTGHGDEVAAAVAAQLEAVHNTEQRLRALSSAGSGPDPQVDPTRRSSQHVNPLYIPSEPGVSLGQPAQMKPTTPPEANPRTLQPVPEAGSTLELSEPLPGIQPLDTQPVDLQPGHVEAPVGEVFQTPRAVGPGSFPIHMSMSPHTPATQSPGDQEASAADTLPSDVEQPARLEAIEEQKATPRDTAVADDSACELSSQMVSQEPDGQPGGSDHEAAPTEESTLIKRSVDSSHDAAPAEEPTLLKGHVDASQEASLPAPPLALSASPRVAFGTRFAKPVERRQPSGASSHGGSTDASQPYRSGSGRYNGIQANRMRPDSSTSAPGTAPASLKKSNEADLAPQRGSGDKPGLQRASTAGRRSQDHHASSSGGDSQRGSGHLPAGALPLASPKPWIPTGTRASAGSVSLISAASTAPAPRNVLARPLWAAPTAMAPSPRRQASSSVGGCEKKGLAYDNISAAATERSAVDKKSPTSMSAGGAVASPPPKSAGETANAKVVVSVPIHVQAEPSADSLFPTIGSFVVTAEHSDASASCTESGTHAAVTDPSGLHSKDTDIKCSFSAQAPQGPHQMGSAHDDTPDIDIAPGLVPASSQHTTTQQLNHPIDPVTLSGHFPVPAIYHEPGVSADPASQSSRAMNLVLSASAPEPLTSAAMLGPISSPVKPGELPPVPETGIPASEELRHSGPAAYMHPSPRTSSFFGFSRRPTHSEAGIPEEDSYKVDNRGMGCFAMPGGHKSRAVTQSPRISTSGMSEMMSCQGGDSRAPSEAGSVKSSWSVFTTTSTASKSKTSLGKLFKRKLSKLFSSTKVLEADPVVATAAMAAEEHMAARSRHSHATSSAAGFGSVHQP